MFATICNTYCIIQCKIRMICHINLQKLITVYDFWHLRLKKYQSKIKILYQRIILISPISNKNIKYWRHELYFSITKVYKILYWKSEKMLEKFFLNLFVKWGTRSIYFFLFLWQLFYQNFVCKVNYRKNKMQFLY